MIVGLILRHDVDNPYVGELGFGLARRKFVWTLNWYRQYGPLGEKLPGFTWFKYLHATKRLFEVEKSLGIEGSWYFRTRTKPYATLRKAMFQNDCEVSFHADRTEDENRFLADMKYTIGRGRPLGFTKHGSARDEAEAHKARIEIYDPTRCLQLAKTQGFKYFCGNGTNPEEEWKVTDGVLYFPSVFWIQTGYMNDEKYTLEWLIEAQRKRDIVLLIHPREYTDLFPNLKAKIDELFRRVTGIISFRTFIMRNSDKLS
jgi:hypothetical protein